MKTKIAFCPPLTGVFELGTLASMCVLPTSTGIQGFTEDSEAAEWGLYNNY